MTEKKPKDEFHLLGVVEDVAIGVRKTDEGETLGIAFRHEEGKPPLPGADFVRGTPRENEPVVDLEVVYSASKGPAKVTTPRYRKNYDAIFGKKRKTDELPN